MTNADRSQLTDRFPTYDGQRHAFRVTKDAMRHIRSGHPWVYEDSITKAPEGRDMTAGDLGVVFDDDRKFAAIGLYDPASVIRLKLLHHGKPETVDATFFANRITTALERRLDLFASADSPDDTSGFRLLHGENDHLPGLVADLYGDTVVAKVYSTAWIPHLAGVLAELVDQVDDLLAQPVRNVVLRLSRVVARATEYTDGEIIFGPPITGPVTFRENGLTFGADVVAGQKTGHFLDQRDNRQAIRHQAQGDVLDVFSSTGGFSVHAAAGGASRVISIDQNQASIDAAIANMARNPETAKVRHDTVCDDAFAVLGDYAAAGRQFDVVVIDPPSFAQKQADVGAAANAYRKLTMLGLAVTKPGGLYLQASCSSRITADAFYDIVTNTAAERNVTLRDQRRTGHCADHPVGFVHGAYLKALFARVD